MDDPDAEVSGHQEGTGFDAKAAHVQAPRAD